MTNRRRILRLALWALRDQHGVINAKVILPPPGVIANQAIAVQTAATANSTTVDLTSAGTAAGSVTVPLTLSTGTIPMYTVCCKIKVNSLTGTGTFTVQSATDTGITTSVQVVAGPSVTITAVGYYLLVGWSDITGQRFLRVTQATFGAINYDFQMIVNSIL